MPASEQPVPVHSAESLERTMGQVLCFVSAKGGTGKTILSATTAYVLLQSGKRVITIDADFSTRGLSLYLLGSILESQDLEIASENCLADAVLEGIPVEHVLPRLVRRGSVNYEVILSNKEVWRGGVPDDRFLGRFGTDEAATAPKVLEYFRFLNDLCKLLRKKYDYVIIDTRGGYDFTSAAPATACDGYIVVMEADRLSIEQISGFKKKIDEFSKQMQERAILRGFIVNKAIFSVDDKVFREELARLYDTKTYGVIPADRDVIRAYQRKNVPLESHPDSDFAYYSLRTIEHLISPESNWRQRDEALSRFQELRSRIRREWSGRRGLEGLQAGLPVAHLLLVMAATAFYFLYKSGAGGILLNAFYIIVATSVLG